LGCIVSKEQERKIVRGEFGDWPGIEGREWNATGIANSCVELVGELEVAGEDSDVDLCFVVCEAQTCLLNFLA
jgi:hypothetical protein